MYICTRNYDLKRGGTFETAKAGTFHSVTAGTLIPLFTSDENTNGAKYFCELLETEDINTRLDRMVVVLTTGEYHNELTEDEQRLCKLLVGDCKSFDILVVTDPKLGRQARIDYATFNSKKH
jgi:hypothetical protein